jgi:transcriptional accessory protein Tex/SPT6
VHKPETPSLLINEFLSQQQKISTENDKLETETQNTEETIKSAVSYYSRKIAFDPRMRLLIYEYVKQVSRISTNPTIKGTKEITTYDLLFPSKHINKLKLKKVKNDLVHLINEAERYDLINYEIDTID